MQFSVVVMPGDGIGQEVVAAALNVLKAIGQTSGHDFKLQQALIGASAFEKEGEALPARTIEMCKNCDAVLFGAVGDPKWEVPDLKVRPELGYGLIRLRRELGLFANLRPVRLPRPLANATNFKPEVVEGIDFVVVRELTGGLYYAEPKRTWETPEGLKAVDTLLYSEQEIERILRVGFELARTRRKKLASVDKFGILQTSGLWRQVALKMAREYPDIELEHVAVDVCAMRIIQRPRDFDVLVTENIFGDILSDESSMLAGSLGMVPSASLAGIPREGKRQFGLYEPIHGSSPRRAGLNMANPIASILSVAMMLRYSLGLEEEAKLIPAAVDAVLEDGYRTYEIMSEGKIKVGTREMGELIASKIMSRL